MSTNNADNRFQHQSTAGPPRISDADSSIIETDIPARLDRLPWGRFHTLIVIALGISWILDGLEVTLAGTMSGAIRTSLDLTHAQVQQSNTAYLLGAILGALFFGRLTDRHGQKTLFFITLAVYMIFTAATAFSWNLASLSLFRFLTGAGIGGEYTAINSAIQEFIPRKYRGHTDLVINGSFGIGAAIGAVGSLYVLDPAIFAPNVGWRFAFFLGALLAFVIFFMRLWIPESPRWLMTHHRVEEAETIIEFIEEGFRRHGRSIPPGKVPRVRLRGRRYTPLREVALTLFKFYPGRTFLGITLMAAQAFFYNAIFFTYAPVLTEFFHIPLDQIGWYLLPFALGNIAGPVLLGRFFDTIGRRPMITLTFATSGLLLTISGALFWLGITTAGQQTMAWMVVFFFASAAASSAYLTVSEIFPLEIRAVAISIFFAIGTGVGGALSPWLFGALIDTGSRASVFGGYLIGSTLMILAALVEWYWGVAAEQKALETVARPLTFTD